MYRQMCIQATKTLGFIMWMTVSQAANAGTVLDLDFSTAAIETDITIPLNSTLEIAVIEVGSVTPGRDRIGLDLYYQKPGDVSPVQNPIAFNALGGNVATVAGTLAGLSASGLSEDLFLPGQNVGNGSGLTPGTLPTVSGWLHNVGGVGYTGSPSVPDFPNQFPVDVVRWSFSFPNVGTVHFTHCGILDNNGSPLLTNANIYHEVDSNTAFPTACSGDVVVRVVPEPTAFLMLSLTLTGLTGRIWLRDRALNTGARFHSTRNYQ